MAKSSNARRVIVVGGGITGLTTAYQLRQLDPTTQVTLLEASPRLGGSIASYSVEGFLIDAGPDCFVRTKPEGAQLVKELGLEDELITTASRRVYIVHHGRLELMPAGMALAVPTRLGPMLRTPLLSLGGKLSMLGDLAYPAGFGRTLEREESIAAFVTRRFGREAAERIAGPLLSGIYAGDVDHLSIEATFPQLLAVERDHGSLIRGLFTAQRRRQGLEAPHGLRSWIEVARWLRRGETEAPSPFYSLKGGMGALIEALAQQLPPESLRLGTPAQRLEASNGIWRVHTKEGSLSADAVVLAAPASATSRLVPDPDLQQELRGIPCVSTATVFFGFDRDAVEHELDGVGFIVPKGEGRIVAATWVSTKWHHRAPEGKVLLRAFLGGVRQDVDVSRTPESTLASIALDELRRLMGRIGTPLFTRVHQYVGTNPQPIVGHLARLERIRARLTGAPGLYLAGGSYDSIGISDSVRHGRATAALVLERKRDAVPYRA